MTTNTPSHPRGLSGAGPKGASPVPETPVPIDLRPQIQLQGVIVRATRPAHGNVPPNPKRAFAALCYSRRH
ncbi:hypothetical protein ANO14919_067920 [Xylariales sp. No.14919]|nr:hypothetical protein ANO14919_067920 [Xylariales sp. No.14919]